MYYLIVSSCIISYCLALYYLTSSIITIIIEYDVVERVENRSVTETTTTTSTSAENIMINVSLDCGEFEKEDSSQNPPTLTRDLLINRILNEEINLNDHRSDRVAKQKQSVSAPASVQGEDFGKNGEEEDDDVDGEEMYNFDEDEKDTQVFGKNDFKDENTQNVPIDADDLNTQVVPIDATDFSTALQSEINVEDASNYHQDMVSMVTRFFGNPAALQTAQTILGIAKKTNAESDSQKTNSNQITTLTNPGLAGSDALALFESLDKESSDKGLSEKDHSLSSSQKKRTEYEQIHDYAIFEALLEILKKWGLTLVQKRIPSASGLANPTIVKARDVHRAFVALSKNGSETTPKHLQLIKKAVLNELQQWDNFDADAEDVRRKVFVENGNQR